MIISYKSYSQELTVHRPPRGTQKFLLQMKRGCILPPETVHMSVQLYCSAEEGPGKPQPLQPGFFLAFKLQRSWLMKAVGSQRPRAKCLKWGVIWSTLNFIGS